MPTEAQTRRERIDPRLTAAGWRIAPFNPAQYLSALDGVALTEFPTENGPADYALIASGKVVGIVEAKKLSLGPQNVLTQAERYARGLLDGSFNFNGLRAPFLYSTNGEVIWFHDVRHPLTRSRKIAGFHTPAALQEMLGRDFEADCQGLLSTPNTHHRLRPYQREANEAMEQAIAARKREMLVAMATGTGKTFTLVNEIYRLMKSGVAKRVLFLVDRRALAAQAVRAFASFDPEPNQKFNQLYEVYSQRFFKDDLDEDEKFDPQGNRRRRKPGRSTRSSRRSGPIGTGIITCGAWSSASSVLPRRCPGRRGRNLPRSSRMATWPASPPNCRKGSGRTSPERWLF